MQQITLRFLLYIQLTQFPTLNLPRTQLPQLSPIAWGSFPQRSAKSWCMHMFNSPVLRSRISLVVKQFSLHAIQATILTVVGKIEEVFITRIRHNSIRFDFEKRKFHSSVMFIFYHLPSTKHTNNLSRLL